MTWKHNIVFYVLKSHEHPFLIYRCKYGQLNDKLTLVKEQKCISTILVEEVDW